MLKRFWSWRKPSPSPIEVAPPEREILTRAVTWAGGVLRVVGWVKWPEADVHLTAALYVDDNLLAELPCNLSRPALMDANPQHGRRGFTFERLLAGQTEAVIRLCVTDAAGHSAERQWTLTTTAPDSRWTDHLDQITHTIQRYSLLNGHEPDMLNWGTGLDMPGLFPQVAVTTPAQDTATLPYLDSSRGLVCCPVERLAEARRVARDAVIYPGTDGLIVEDVRLLPPLPSVSIIIPIHNQAALLRDCLHHLRRTLPPFLDCEVIALDDASTDSVPDVLAEWAGAWPLLRVLRSATQGGFGHSVMQAVEAARGDYLVFLNSDTQPQPGWLPPLLRTFTQYADAGAVCGKLLFPDGTLQEAGCVVFRDGICRRVGVHSAEPDHPLYQFVRPVDFGSGALLATRRADFLALGGFDKRYQPAYYEDVDYCFRLREQGRRVYYQPESVVVHVGGASYGEDGTRAALQQNRVRFVERWQHVLSGQPVLEMPVNPFRIMLNGEKRVLYQSLTCPTLVHRGDARRARQLIEMLSAQGWQVVIVVHHLPSDVLPALRELQQAGYPVFAGFGSPGWASAYLPDMGILLGEVSFDLAVLTQWRMIDRYLPALRAYPIPVLLDMVDLYFMREIRMAFLQPDPIPAHVGENFVREMEAYRAVDGVLAVSQKECDLVADLVGKLTLVFNVSMAETHASAPPPFDGRHGILFVGNFTYHANVDAVVFLLESVLPLLDPALLAQHPVYIIGPNLSEALAQRFGTYTHVHLLGWVDDLLPYLHRCRISVVPLLTGSGVKGKVLQTMAAGTPAVTTQIGVEGMNIVPGEHVLVADDPAAFAQDITRLLTDPALWERVSQQGRDAVLGAYGWDVIAGRLAAAVEAVMQRPVNRPE